MKILTSYLVLPVMASVLMISKPAFTADKNHQHAQMTHMKQAADTAAVLSETRTVQTVCPVMGGEINRNLYVDYENKRIYMCCKACLEMFKKNPQKYIKASEEKGIRFEAVPSAGERRQSPSAAEQ